jgi:hypothetical protein
MKRLSISLLAALLLAAAVPALASAAVRPITFNAVIGDRCLRGFASDSATVKVVLRDSNGVKKSGKTFTARSDGSFTVCGLHARIAIGDTLHAEDGNSVHDFVIPLLTGFGNRDKDVYKGQGPAGDYVKLICAFGNGFEPCQATFKVHVNSEGKWSLKPGWDVQGGETFYVQWKSPAGDKANVIATPPYLIARIGTAQVRGETRSGSTPTIVLKRGPALDVVAMANPQADVFDGEYTGALRNMAGNKVAIHTGDVITSDMSSEIDWVVPDIQANGNSSTDRVHGYCHWDDPSYLGELRIDIYRSGEFVTGSEITDGVEEDGSFHVNMHPGFQAGDRIEVQCGMGAGDFAEEVFTAF